MAGGRCRPPHDFSGGRIKFLALFYKDKNYYFIEDGRVFTRQGSDPHEDFEVMHELVSKFQAVGAVRL